MKSVYEEWKRRAPYLLGLLEASWEVRCVGAQLGPWVLPKACGFQVTLTHLCSLLDFGEVGHLCAQWSGWEQTSWPSVLLA